MRMSADRSRFTGLVLAVCVACMLAASAVWVAGAESKPRTKPAPEGRTPSPSAWWAPPPGT